MFFPERRDWKDIQGPPMEGDIWFTDGSKTGESSGVVLYCRQEGLRKVIPLGRYATVFQVATVAIMRCAQILLELKRKGKRIRIFSNSQVALKALGIPIFTSLLIWACRCALEELAQNNAVILMRVPG